MKRISTLLTVFMASIGALVLFLIILGSSPWTLRPVAAADPFTGPDAIEQAATPTITATATVTGTVIPTVTETITGTVTPTQTTAPTSTPTPVPSPVADNVYVVQPNDNLTAIANQFDTTVNELVALNNIADPNVLFVGQELLLPTPTVSPTITATATATVTATVTPPIVTPTPTATPSPTGTAALPPTPTVTSTVPLTTAQIVSPAVTTVWTPPDDAIEVLSPVTGAAYHSPIQVHGYSRTFEGNVIMRLLDEENNVIAQRNATGGSVDGFDFFQTLLRFVTQEEQEATLEVFEQDAATGDEINLVSIPILILPGQRLIDVEQPTVGAAVCSPFIISGYSNTFEGNVVIELSERDGSNIDLDNTNGGTLGLYAEFLASAPLDVSEPQPLLVGAYDLDAAGLGAVDLTRVPVAIYPPESVTCP